MLQTLWIMRHGLAESEFASDFTRALAEKGKSQAINASQQLLADPVYFKDLPLDMLASPFKRTQQTAALVHQTLRLTNAMTTDEMLVHFADHRLLGDYLKSCSFEKLIIVSHMPIVAKLCQYLDPLSQIYGFQTAQIVRLDFTQGGKATVTKIYTA